ncbi:MAG: hypothetical protein DHS20C16_03970 [Phycisphaerae bacterium]|nr:MAG: hypothetical protein DHS20C16_03970 [Phycisphaerae bacterium]
MRMTPTSVNNGFVDNVSLDRVFNEGTPGTGTGAAPVLTNADIYGIGVSTDNSLFWTSGSGNVLNEDGTGTMSKNTLHLVHSEGFDQFGDPLANPRNIGPDFLYNGILSGAGVPSLDAGQLRGVDELDSGELTVSLAEGTDYYSDRINDPTIDFEGNGQILGLDPVTKILDIIYDGDRFFSDVTLGTTDGEIMGFDVLDSSDAVLALAQLLGTDSPGGIALAAFPEPSSIMLFCVGSLAAIRRRRAIRK